MHQNLILATEV